MTLRRRNTLLLTASLGLTTLPATSLFAQAKKDTLTIAMALEPPGLER
jgi:hypothetical protein